MPPGITFRRLGRRMQGCDGNGELVHRRVGVSACRRIGVSAAPVEAVSDSS